MAVHSDKISTYLKAVSPLNLREDSANRIEIPGLGTDYTKRTLVQWLRKWKPTLETLKKADIDAEITKLSPAEGMPLSSDEQEALEVYSALVDTKPLKKVGLPARIEAIKQAKKNNRG